MYIVKGFEFICSICIEEGVWVGVESFSTLFYQIKEIENKPFPSLDPMLGIRCRTKMEKSVSLGIPI